MGKNES